MDTLEQSLKSNDLWDLPGRSGRVKTIVSAIQVKRSWPEKTKYNEHWLGNLFLTVRQICRGLIILLYCPRGPHRWIGGNSHCSRTTDMSWNNYLL